MWKKQEKSYKYFSSEISLFRMILVCTFFVGWQLLSFLKYFFVYYYLNYNLLYSYVRLKVVGNRCLRNATTMKWFLKSIYYKENKGIE